MRSLGPYSVPEKKDLKKFLQKLVEKSDKQASNTLTRWLKNNQISEKEYYWLVERRYGILSEGEVKEIPEELARKIGEKLNVNFDETNFEEFRKGIGVEMEHSGTMSGGFETAAKIALDHLSELPDYYSKLDKMEKG